MAAGAVGMDLRGAAEEEGTEATLDGAEAFEVDTMSWSEVEDPSLPQKVMRRLT